MRAHHEREGDKVNIEILELTEETLRDAPEWKGSPFSCKYCLYWEFPEECTHPAIERKEERLEKKGQWLQQARETFGNCGRIAYVDGKPAAYAQYAPPRLLPCSASYPAGPPSDDAILISCLFIASPELRGLGVGRLILQSILDDLRQRGIKAAETFARRGSEDNPSGPLEFYLRHGFRVYHDDPEFALMRLDL